MNSVRGKSGSSAGSFDQKKPSGRKGNSPVQQRTAVPAMWGERGYLRKESRGKETASKTESVTTKGRRGLRREVLRQS